MSEKSEAIKTLKAFLKTAENWKLLADQEFGDDPLEDGLIEQAENALAVLR